MFDEQFIAKRSMESVLSAAVAFAPLLSLAGVANFAVAKQREARFPIGVRFALGGTAGELARRDREVVAFGILPYSRNADRY